MREKIIAGLHNLQSLHDITILHAVESGSRAWGFASPDSDYDVRFIYHRSPEWYLSITQQREDTIVLEPDEFDLDYSGWDLRKALILATTKSNATVWEWLQSPIIYYQKEGFDLSMLDAIKSCFSARKALHHYLGVAHSRIELLKTDEPVKLKSFFYALRALLAAAWIKEKSSPPPMTLKDLLDVIDDTQILQEVESLVACKSELTESDKLVTPPVVDKFFLEIYEECRSFEQLAPVAKVDFQKIDSFFFQTVTV